jgi:hypothetical protein
MGLFISSTKMSTWRHSLIWFADDLKMQLWQLILSSPTPVCRQEEEREDEERKKTEGEERRGEEMRLA